MGDGLRKNLCNRGTRVTRSNKEKKNIIVLIAILTFSVGVFFCPAPKSIVAQAKTGVAKSQTEISLSKLVPEKKIGEFVYKNPEVGEKFGKAQCAESKASAFGTKGQKVSVYAMVTGHPIEEMVPFIEKRDKRVASFLIAIAKKESDWGTYSPKKSGQDCFNYWGFKGAYKLTESGYSCFDSPEQAVQVVGDRIEKLLGDKIDTPSRMIVWKCGSTCVGHDPEGVKKWISDVTLYYGKMNS